METRHVAHRIVLRALLALLILLAAAPHTPAQAGSCTPLSRLGSWPGYMPSYSNIAATGAYLENGVLKLWLFSVASDQTVDAGVYDGQSWAWQNVPNALSTYGIAAASRIMEGSSEVDLFAVTSDGSIQEFKHCIGFNCTLPSAIGAHTHYAPATTYFNGQLYLFYVGTDNSLWYTVTTGTTWQAARRIGGTTDYAPAVATINNQLHLFAVGTDHSVWEMVSSDGINWTGWNGLGGTTYYAPAAMTVSDSNNNSKLYLFDVSTGTTTVYDRIFDGHGWTNGWTNVATAPYRLQAAPAVTRLFGQPNNVYLFVPPIDSSTVHPPSLQAHVYSAVCS